jgi:hypothetical protein
MNKKLVVILIVLIVLACITVVQGEVSVGVKEGDWIEYEVTTTGTPVPDHDIVWARMEILDVQGNEFRANVTSEKPTGELSSLIRTFNLEEGEVQGWVIIPANLDVGDTFYDSYIGRNVTIEGEEERVIAGATRTTTYANLPERFKRWDKSTGVFVETIDPLENYTIHATAIATNMWSPQIFGLDPPLFYAVVLVVAIIVIVVVTSVILRIYSRKK